MFPKFEVYSSYNFTEHYHWDSTICLFAYNQGCIDKILN